MKEKKREREREKDLSCAQRASHGTHEAVIGRKNGKKVMKKERTKNDEEKE